nr:immunoglobulin heavy chain junction region [Macaca mulatta]MOV41860.1 immunoglobulin heavy chain junction region [Macaca mulatta]MOV45504.1 immunoglobulin heavy chain junction region [Macaca mulatta]
CTRSWYWLEFSSGLDSW